MRLADYEDFIYAGRCSTSGDPIAPGGSSASAAAAGRPARRGAGAPRRDDGTDLTVGVEGRTWINCDGHENFPDGEVFTGPIETSAEGVVRYSSRPSTAAARSTASASRFKGGEVVEATAGAGEEFLIAMLDQDEGARVLGELAIGTNYSIQQYTKDTLFDEKIGGTFHAAARRGLPRERRQERVRAPLGHGLRPARAARSTPTASSSSATDASSTGGSDQTASENVSQRPGSAGLVALEEPALASCSDEPWVQDSESTRPAADCSGSSPIAAAACIASAKSAS